LYMANSLATAVSEPALYRLLTFHVPKKMSIFHCLLHDTPSRNTPPPEDPSGGVVYLYCFVSRGSISPSLYFLTWVFTRRVVSTFPNPQAGGLPLVGCPRLLIQCIRSYPPYWRPFLHPQLEDVPCFGDRDPLKMEKKTAYTAHKEGLRTMQKVSFVNR
jgi:hypothetical protein